ncbi:hypothetical protein DEIPH_ctg041orf0023 [Deinococcus phoenicis]|uniref:Uncharacterized protein n=1 Tax=Deinococcus phoenicis TaxID=1476583 RepID=A0A016QNS4_9DEIO|nr:hypothetical protein [Deinococcus phoenicis]EYB67424.1 hypothetical protein DEIPH_ctg041orf0023 [Deinococcus phoenicis]
MTHLVRILHRLIFNGPHWLFRLFTALGTFAFGVVCLCQPDLFSHGPSFSGMAWLPQLVWGLVATVAGLALFALPGGLPRRLAYLAAFFFHLCITVSFTLGAGTVLTGSTTYGLLALLIALATITEPHPRRL